MGKGGRVTREGALFDNLVVEFGNNGERAVTFLRTAGALLTFQPTPDRLGEAVCYCVREALTAISKVAASEEDPGWRALSRAVTEAKRRYEAAADLPGSESEALLRELLVAVDHLDDYHGQGSVHQRGLITLVLKRSGVRPLELKGLADPVRDYQSLIDRANGGAHGDAAREQAAEILAEALALLTRFFLPPVQRLAELDELAALEKPEEADLSRLLAAVSTPNHVDYFFRHAGSPAWLDLLHDSGLVTPPDQGDAWPVWRMFPRLKDSHGVTLHTWLRRAYAEWGRTSGGRWHLANAAAELGLVAHELLVKALEDEGTHGTVQWVVLRVLGEFAPHDRLIERIADVLLNKGARDENVHRMRLVTEVLVAGVDEENWQRRLELLRFKLRGLNDGDDGLFLLDTARSIAELDDSEDRDHHTLLTATLFKCMEKVMELGVPPTKVLAALNGLPAKIQDRLRAWVLAHAPDTAIDDMIDEITEAIAARSPSRDDIDLVDRVVESADPAGYEAAWTAAMGDPPGARQLGEALGAHSVEERWFQARDWSAILPDPVTAGWQTVLMLLAGAYGPKTREDLQRPATVETGWGRSPISKEELAGLDPADATGRIAAWRPAPADWLVSARELARELQAVVSAAPEQWAQEPLAKIGSLREPVYVGHYFRGLADATALPADAGPALVGAVEFARTHPWKPLRLGRDDFDYDPDWTDVDDAGVKLIAKLAGLDLDLGAADAQAWELVLSAARDRGRESSLISPRDDPLATALNRACTLALDATFGLMGRDSRAGRAPRPQALDLLDEALRIPGWDGAEHRAMIVTRIGYLRYVASEWVDARADLLFGEEAPGDLGEVSLALALQWAHPNRWVLERFRDGVLRAVPEKKRALKQSMVAMLWEVPGYSPEELADAFLTKDPAILSAGGERLGRLLSADEGDEPEERHVEVGVVFWRRAIASGRSEALAGFGWWAEVEALDQSTWEELTLATARSAGGALDWMESVARRAARSPVSLNGLSILAELLVGVTDEWERPRIAELCIEALRAANEEIRTDSAFTRLKTVLVERGFYDAKDL